MEIVAQTLKLINTFEDLGLTYWIESEKTLDNEKRAVLAYRIKSISSQLAEKLNTHKDIGVSTSRDLTRLRKSITGGTFESKSFIPDRSRAILINAAASSFRRTIESMVNRGT